jgi:hypothetical protein
MRPDRITQKQAQGIWDAIKASITLAPCEGAAFPLPAIDMAAIFNGRKSMTHKAIVSAIREKIDAAIPT